MKKEISIIWIVLIVAIILIVLTGGYFLFFNKVGVPSTEPECRDENYKCTLGDISCCEGLIEVGLYSSEGERAKCGSVCRPCGNGICDSNENKYMCPEDCAEELECVDEGETLGGYTAEPDYRTCCKGLNRTSQGYFAGDDGKCIIMADAGSMCTKCGNGICGSGENKCNCPVDCNCVSEGEEYSTMPLPNGNQNFCCAGLESISVLKDGGELMDVAYCTKCGDGICKAPEVAGNCPADCS